MMMNNTNDSLIMTVFITRNLYNDINSNGNVILTIVEIFYMVAIMIQVPLAIVEIFYMVAIMIQVP